MALTGCPFTLVPVIVVVSIFPSWVITKVPTWTSFPAFRRTAIKLKGLASTFVITVASKSGKPGAEWGGWHAHLRCRLAAMHKVIPQRYLYRSFPLRGVSKLGHFAPSDGASTPGDFYIPNVAPKMYRVTAHSPQVGRHGKSK